MDYSKYTYEELMEAYNSINKEKYPENYAALLLAIEKVKNSHLSEYQHQVTNLNLEENSEAASNDKLPVTWYAIFSIFLLWMALDTYIDGYHFTRGGGEITRTEDPFWFYLFIAIYLGGAAFTLFKIPNALRAKRESKNT